MANKKANKKPINTSENRDAARRTRILQIIFVAFSIMLILSMVLSLASK
jgi:hypothetical protein